MYRIVLTLFIMAWAATAPAAWYDAPGGAATSVTDGDILVVSQGGVTRSVTRAQLVEGSVRTTGAQTVNGTKTFTDAIVGSVTGNAGSVTNGAYLGTDNAFTGINSFEQAIIAPNIVPGVYFVGGPGMETLQTAVTALGSIPATLKYGTNQTLTGNLTVPETLVLDPFNGATITHGTYTVSVASSTSGWDMRRKFSGTGAVTGLRESRPEWFGAVGNDVADDAAAMQQAINASRTLLISKMYYVGSALTFPCDQGGYSILGLNFRSTGIRSAAPNAYAFTYSGAYRAGGGSTGRGLVVKNVTMHSANATTSGWYIQAASNVYWDNVRLKGFAGGSQMVLSQVWDSWWYNCYFDEHTAAASASTVIDTGATDNSNNLRFVGCTWEGIAYEAIRFTDGGSGMSNYAINFSKCKFEFAGSSAKVHAYSGGLINVTFTDTALSAPSGTSQIFKNTSSEIRHLVFERCPITYAGAVTVPAVATLTNAREVKLTGNRFLTAGAVTDFFVTTNCIALYADGNTHNAVPLVNAFSTAGTDAGVINGPVQITAKNGTPSLFLKRYDAAGALLTTFEVKPVSDGTVQILAGNTPALTINTDGTVTVLKGLTHGAVAAASVPNSTQFRDSADNKLKFKDSGGVVNPLY